MRLGQLVSQVCYIKAVLFLLDSVSSQVFIVSLFRAFVHQKSDSDQVHLLAGLRRDMINYSIHCRADDEYPSHFGNVLHDLKLFWQS